LTLVAAVPLPGVDAHAVRGFAAVFPGTVTGTGRGGILPRAALMGPGTTVIGTFPGMDPLIAVSVQGKAGPVTGAGLVGAVDPLAAMHRFLGRQGYPKHS